MRRFCSLSFFFFWLPIAAIQAQSVTITFDSSVVETGEAFRAICTVNGAEPDTLRLDAWQSWFPPQNQLARSPWQPQPNGYVSDIQLIAFDEGVIELPPLTVVLKNGDTLQSNTTRLEIKATPIPSTDLNDMADIKTIHKEPALWTDYLWIAWILAGLLLLWLLWYLWTRRKTKAMPAVFRSEAMPPRTLALKKLQHLADKNLWQKGEIKAYYAELSFIVREFLDHEYQTGAVRKGEKEVLNDLKVFPLSEDQQIALQTLLQNAALAKFAKGQPDPNYHPQAMNDALRVVSSEGQDLL